jgi:DNA-binding response OmpR family regulator
MEQKNQNSMVLIVDDTPKNIQLIGSILMEQKYRISVAKNGREALKVVKDVKPDIILLDIMMPELDGFETCKHLKNSEETRDIPVIFLTAKIEAEDIVKAFELGAVDYIIKPFNSKELMVRVNTHLELKYAHEKIKKSEQELRKVNEKITDSINYAQHIQSAILPHQEYMMAVMPEYFVLYKPRDIVSGDFYWIKEVKNNLIVVVADCTGHGIPGAFMSMLGITLLNEQIGRSRIDKPGEMLGQLRLSVKELLAQEGKMQDQKDGMDMAIFIFDKDNNELQFAGANIPLYVIRKKEQLQGKELESYISLDNEDFQLFELKGNRQPIGVNWEETDFTNHSIGLQKQDSIYIFSDGIVDQYGGENRKKYKSVNFKKLLLSIQEDSMEKQKQLIENAFETWRGDNEQIDDVCVVGLRVY